MAGQVGYALGSSDLEHQRLMVQARFLRPMTEHFLRAGGLRPGMSVLDLGSGVGDVSLLAAGIVGPEGHVTGIDRDEAVVGKARRRVANEALSDAVTFQVADLADYRPDGPIDAVIGRFVLLYQDDPAATLRRSAEFLRPGGVLIFHELDLTYDSPSYPPSPAWDECIRLVHQAYVATGGVTDVGRRFSHLFRSAGLPAPVVESLTPIANTAHSPILDWGARTMVSLEPLFTRIGATMPLSLDYAELITQFRAAVAAGGQLKAPGQYGAWTRLA